VIDGQMADVKRGIWVCRLELLYGSLCLCRGSRAHVDVGTFASKMRNGVSADARIATSDYVCASGQVGERIRMESHYLSWSSFVVEVYEDCV
jgi:hypothetical protein